jgi:hypothetical protein
MGTPESADRALLDVFTVSGGEESVEGGQPLEAGKTNLNTRQERVLRALLKGALKNASRSTGKISLIEGPEADRIARKLIERTRSSQGWKGPLTNPAELVGKLVGKNRSDCEDNSEVYTSRIFRSACEPDRNPDILPGRRELLWHFSGLSQDLAGLADVEPSLRNIRVIESAVRALADAGQTRVWNLMVDLILQTAKTALPTEGREGGEPRAEVRAWVHIAIDRLTGTVLDAQWEWVGE